MESMSDGLAGDISPAYLKCHHEGNESFLHLKVRVWTGLIPQDSLDRAAQTSDERVPQLLDIALRPEVAGRAQDV